jgi:hypothetical protein
MKHAPKSVGRSVLGTRILQPATSKGATITLGQVRAALRALSSSAAK